MLRDVTAEVLLLIDGTNDMLGDQSPGAITSTVEALQNMIGQARGRGMTVYVATLPPLRQSAAVSSGAVAAIPVLNERIKTLAAPPGVNLVDLYAAVPVGQIGSDGKHPTQQGNETIATTFFNAIVATLEVRAPALSQSLQPVRAIR